MHPYGVVGGPMASKGNSKIDALTALPGIGAATAKKLISAKIDTVSKIASAGSKKLQDAGLSAAVAKKVGAAAKAADKASKSAKRLRPKPRQQPSPPPRKPLPPQKKQHLKPNQQQRKCHKRLPKQRRPQFLRPNKPSNLRSRPMAEKALHSVFHVV